MSTATGRTYLPFLDVTRILAVLGVVAIHVVGGSVAAGEVGLGIVALDMGLIAAVPVFFMMSGALTLDPRAHRRGTADFLRRRAVRIIPATIVWSAFYIVVIRGAVSGGEVTPGALLGMVVDGTTYTHLYFLFAIAGLYLLAPVLHPFLAENEGSRTWVVGLVACLWTLVVTGIGRAGDVIDGSPVPLQLGTFTFALVYLGYFVLGRAVLVRPIPRSAAVVGLMSVPGFVALLTWSYLRSRRAAAEGDPDLWERLLAPGYIALPVMVYSLVLMASISSLCRGWRVGSGTEKVLRTLGTATFGIFLVHFAVLVVLRTSFPALDSHDGPALLVLWTATAVISSAIALVGQRVPLLRLVF
jgi:surface polysaccharide O-acyltransferase-like enzyme